ncbi:hypothetical protein M2480_003080 [Parabacteroides sp. PFB2-12]|uniref:Imm40 family immunity protein n=1 Tax=unclassified Parabacteroides TaxID=2649774 RepID=UPI0024737DD8|nr:MULTISPECIES: Imm40 family immunity protein [unclassified Parabacteroides]MDH6344165.1 hypothetical protein [Parabacteroides sp. PM6-13]MDH6392072.1 hypothetical protein [Parabacteroides sp. PFB2-12]
MYDYQKIIEKRGRALSEVNPGSSEYALSVNDSLEIIDILLKQQIPILGGDIISEKSGKLIYAYQLWGIEYHYLNWCCDKMENESKKNYILRSYNIAKETIVKALDIANHLHEKCYIVLVT